MSKITNNETENVLIKKKVSKCPKPPPNTREPSLEPLEPLEPLLVKKVPDPPHNSEVTSEDFMLDLKIFV